MNEVKLKNGFKIGWLEGTTRNSFQHNSIIQIVNNKEQMAVPRGMPILQENLAGVSVCLAVRKAIPATWLNDRDQFLYPNENWKTNKEFQNDCLAFTLFDGSNNIQSKFGTNHWIPFTEQEVNAKEKFESNFMTNFITGKLKPENPENETLFGENASAKIYDDQPRIFSQEAKEVFDAGRELWKYYHAQKDVNVNASLYDIREYFQGRNDKGRMNARSSDETYTELIAELRNKLSILAEKIQPKIYEYGFLKE